MKKNAVIFLCFLIVICFSSWAFGDEIVIVNYNVWSGIDGKGLIKMGEFESAEVRLARYKILVDGLVDTSPDIVGIQEANKLPGFTRRLGRDICCDPVWRIANSGLKLFGFGFPTNFTEGEAILAKKRHGIKYLKGKRLSGGGIQRDCLSVHFNEVRYAMAARVIIDGAPLIIFNTHTHYSLLLTEEWIKKVDSLFDSGEITEKERDAIKEKMIKSYERTKNDIRNLAAFIKEITAEYDEPYIVMGDFNATLEIPALREMVDELGLLDTYRIMNPENPGYTWDVKLNPNTVFEGGPYYADKTLRSPLGRLKAEYTGSVSRRIDFIFLSNHFTPDMVTEAELFLDKPKDGLYASDHFGLKVVIKGIPK